jgi:hypothetical protein
MWLGPRTDRGGNEVILDFVDDGSIDYPHWMSGEVEMEFSEMSLGELLYLALVGRTEAGRGSAGAIVPA